MGSNPTPSAISTCLQRMIMTPAMARVSKPRRQRHRFQSRVADRSPARTSGLKVAVSLVVQGFSGPLSTEVRSFVIGRKRMFRGVVMACCWRGRCLADISAICS